MTHIEPVAIPSAVQRLAVHLRWQSGSDDLRYSLFLYDEAVSLVRKVNSLDASPYGGEHWIKCIHDGLGHRAVIDLSHSNEVVAVLVDIAEKEVYNDNDLLIISLKDASDYAPPGVLMEMKRRMKNEYKRLGVLALHIHRELSSESIRDNDPTARNIHWVAVGVYQPVLAYALHDTDAIYSELMIKKIPLFVKFKRKQLNDIAEVCTALTTRNLLFFKDLFNDAVGGLEVDAFTEVLFIALGSTYPKLLDEDERAFAVALLNELFYQIGENHGRSFGTRTVANSFHRSQRQRSC